MARLEFLTIFRDRSDKPSMMRLVLFLWAVGGFGIWAYSSLAAGSLQAFPDSIAAIIATLAGSKAVQSFAERP